MAERGDSNWRNCNRSAAGSPQGPDSVRAKAVDLDVSWLACPDLSAIDVLARLHVIARQCGQSLCLHGATSELIELLELVGLREMIHLCLCGTFSADRWR